MNEDKLDLILHEIQGIKSDITGMKSDIVGLQTEMSNMNDRFDGLDEKLDVVYEQAAKNTEMITEIKELHLQQDLTLNLLSRRSLDHEAKLQYVSCM